MKSSEILRGAAERMEAVEMNEQQSGAGCYSIARAAGRVNEWWNGETAHAGAMAHFSLMKPAKARRSDLWWSTQPAGKCARIVGLCLAAAIAESEGD